MREWLPALADALGAKPPRHAGYGTRLGFQMTSQRCPSGSWK